MMKPTSITYTEAVQMLSAGQLAEGYEISFGPDDQVKAAHALKLRKLGYTVPDKIIKYPDDLGEQMEDDEFEGDWTPINSDREDHKKHYTISLDVDQEVEQWLKDSEIDVDALVSELVAGFYRSVKVVNDKS